MNSVNIAIAIYHDILRDGLKLILEDESWISISKSVNNKNDLIAAASQNTIDILILDLDIPDLNIPNIIRILRKENTGISILAISDSHQHHQIKPILQAGASGFMFKQKGKDDLIKAVEMIRSGK